MGRRLLSDSTIKLSTAQTTVIQKLQEGEKLHFITGLNARCFFGNMNVWWNTITKLEGMGLISRNEKERQVSLTDRGSTLKLVPTGKMGKASLLLPAKDRRYRPTLEQWGRIDLNTEFTANEEINFRDIDYIDFDLCCVVLKSRKRVYFDCINEDKYVHVCNGGYHEDAPDIIESQRI